jgi:Flp pilus assembly pilin Flp
MIRSPFPALLRDERGVTAIEFALIAPVLLMMVLGLFDMGHNMYTTSMLQGAVQQAARNSTIEGAASQSDALDANVTTAVHAISPHAVLQFRRTAYSSFSDVSRPEDFTDVDNDGSCDNGEPFEDANGNGAWDSDRGTAGQGGARDAVLYTVGISYPRLFPIARFVPGMGDQFSMVATTVLRNQPYGLQESTASVTGNCT